MNDEAWKDFFTDYQTKRALDSSEVWKNYASAEIARDELSKKVAFESKLDSENELFEFIDTFRERVEASPKLKQELKKAANALRDNPELKSKVDPSFIYGLSLLDLED